MDPSTPLSPSELSDLRGFFDGFPDSMTLLEAEGFLTAIVSAPTTFMPSKWQPVMLGEHSFETKEDASRFYGLLMRFYNQIVHDLMQGDPIRPDLSMCDEDLHEWCAGYMDVVNMDDAWREDEESFEVLTPILIWSSPIEDDPGPALKAARVLLPELVVAIHRNWLEWRRTEAPIRVEAEPPKIGRNEPCPCGSGAKFKRCCGG